MSANRFKLMAVDIIHVLAHEYMILGGFRMKDLFTDMINMIAIPLPNKRNPGFSLTIHRSLYTETFM